MAKGKRRKKATTGTRSVRKKAPALKAGRAKRKGKRRGGRTRERVSDLVAPPKGKKNRRWKRLSLEQLQALYLEKVGRPSGSSDRVYLIWKVREAEKGNVPVGPVKRTLFEGPATAITIKLEDTFLEELTAAAKDDGFKTRLGYLRDLIGKGLEVRGRRDLAAKVVG